MRNIIVFTFFHKSNWLLRIECVIKTLYVVTKSAGDMSLILLVAEFGWHVDSSMNDSKLAHTINGTRTDLLWFLKDIFDSSSGSSNCIASYDLQYSWWDASDSFELKVFRHRNHTYLALACLIVVTITGYLYPWPNSNVVFYHLKLIKEYKIFVTKYINRNWKIWFSNLLITIKLSGTFRPSQLRTFDVSRSIWSIK